MNDEQLPTETSSTETTDRKYDQWFNEELERKKSQLNIIAFCLTVPGMLLLFSGFGDHGDEWSNVIKFLLYVPLGILLVLIAIFLLMRSKKYTAAKLNTVLGQPHSPSSEQKNATLKQRSKLTKKRSHTIKYLIFCYLLSFPVIFLLLLLLGKFS